jgi:two-component sensor histidine kinase
MPSLTTLLASTSGLPHGACLLWEAGLVWLHVLADGGIALAYYAIPLSLIYFVRRRQDLAFHWMFWLFGAFIFACGTTHLVEVWTLWQPVYGLEGLIKAVTAGVSLATAALLVPLVPKALALPSPAQLEEANRALQHEVAEREQAEAALRTLNAELDRRVQECTAALQAEIAERRQAEDEAERRRHEAEVVAQITQALTASLHLDVVLQRVAEAAQELSDSERALIFLREPGAETFRTRYQVGLPAMPFADLRIEPGKGIGGLVLLTGRPVRTANYAADPSLTKDYLPQMRAAGQLAVITVPITIGSRIEGLLYVSNRAAQPFTARGEDVLRHLAGLAATAIHNAQLYQDAQAELARRTQVEAQLTAALREKEVLLREIHHRVKNNLQVISSLLSLQSESLPDPQLCAVFEDSQQRIQAMALVHESLYQSRDLARIDAADYVRRLSTRLRQAYEPAGDRIAVRLAVEPVALEVQTAMACGLILQELLSNSFKHAFPGERRGEIGIALQVAPGARIVLTVWDTGVGLPAGLDFRHTESLGLQLVCLLTEQLGGTVELAQTSGTHWTLTFPLAGASATPRQNGDGPAPHGGMSQTPS